MLDKLDPYGSTRPYSKTVIQWTKHSASGYWLPSAIESEELGKNGSSYTIKVQWWVNEEVPEEIFGFEDFKKAVLRRSKAHELIQLRKDSKSK